MNEKPLMPEFYDKFIACVDCGRDFVFIAGEQSFYWSKGLIPPKRCPSCRKFRKSTIARRYEDA